MNIPETGRALVILGPDSHTSRVTESVTLEGVTLRCGFIEIDSPRFDPDQFARHLVVRKLGFAVNYRDRAIALAQAVKGKPNSFIGLGSDFIGEIIACGAEVTEFKPGDRVISNADWPMAGEAGVAPGIPGNSASREIQILHACKLIRVPDAMSNAVGAGFTIGAQTAFSLVRRMQPLQGKRVLITAARSNTSLFILAALQGQGAHVHVSTRSANDHEALVSLGVEAIIEPGEDEKGHLSFLSSATVRTVMSQGGYDRIFDPFSDLHLAAAIDVMGFESKYITCGVQDQHSHLVGRGDASTGGRRPNFNKVMPGNLSLIGNCLGTREDLAHAIEDHAAGRFNVVVDSVFSDTRRSADFIQKSWLAPDRFGRVVFLYKSAD